MTRNIYLAINTNDPTSINTFKTELEAREYVIKYQAYNLEDIIFALVGEHKQAVSLIKHFLDYDKLKYYCKRILDLDEFNELFTDFKIVRTTINI